MKRRIEKNDLILIGVLLTVALVVFFVGNYFYKKDGTKVVVTVDGEIYGTYSLGEKQTIAIKKDEKTTNILQIENGQAVMISADCPDQLCVHQKAITKEGQTIVCLPNKVVAEVTGSQTDEKDLDAVVK
ncbi:MAG: NusG domain II-containing protein [Lachnospiraceae bacterium]